MPVYVQGMQRTEDDTRLAETGDKEGCEPPMNTQN